MIDLKSSFVLEQVKETTALPLETVAASAPPPVPEHATWAIEEIARRSGSADAC